MNVGGWTVAGRLAEDRLGPVFLVQQGGGGRSGSMRPFGPDTLARPGVRDGLLGLARRLAVSDHPGLVPVLDLVAAGDHWYLVTELVAGPSLHDLLDPTAGAGRIAGWAGDPASAVAVAADTAETLLALHRSGMAHGALSPGAVLIGAQGGARLADTGLVALLSGSPADAAADLRAWADLARRLGSGWAAPGSGPAASLQRAADRAAPQDGRPGDLERALGEIDRASLPAGQQARSQLRAAVQAWVATAPPPQPAGDLPGAVAPAAASGTATILDIPGAGGDQAVVPGQHRTLIEPPGAAPAPPAAAAPPPPPPPPPAPAAPPAIPAATMIDAPPAPPAAPMAEPAAAPAVAAPIAASSPPPPGATFIDPPASGAMPSPAAGATMIDRPPPPVPLPPPASAAPPPPPPAQAPAAGSTMIDRPAAPPGSTMIDRPAAPFGSTMIDRPEAAPGSTMIDRPAPAAPAAPPAPAAGGSPSFRLGSPPPPAAEPTWIEPPPPPAPAVPPASSATTTAAGVRFGQAPQSAASGSQLLAGASGDTAEPAWQVPVRQARRRSRTWLYAGLVALAGVVVIGVIVGVVAGRSTSLQVTSASVKPNHERAGCGQPVDVSGTIQANGGEGTIDYTWKQDGVVAGGVQHQPISKGQNEVTVHLLWTLTGKGTHDAVATLTVTSPNALAPATGHFTYSC